MIWYLCHLYRLVCPTSELGCPVRGGLEQCKELQVVSGRATVGAIALIVQNAGIGPGIEELARGLQTSGVASSNEGSPIRSRPGIGIGATVQQEANQFR